MNSMTGFGKAESKTNIGKFIVEISSVNNRYLEVSTRLPRQFFSLEAKVRELVSSKLSRGKINFYVGFEEPDNERGKYILNVKAAKAYYRQLLTLKKNLKLPGDIEIQDLILLPELVNPERNEISERKIWPALKSTAEKAMRELVTMRKREGAMLARDMKKRVNVIASTVKDIVKNSSQYIDAYREKLMKKLNDILKEPLPDNNRLEEEIVLIAERTDITEECTRLESHINQFKINLNKKEPVGKKLNFILQEMNREANTIASKCSAVSIASAVIPLKEEIEKLREQVQNVE